MNLLPRLNLLTWQVHSNYLYYLSKIPHDFWVVVNGSEGRLGAAFPWGDNIHEIEADSVKELGLDGIIYQTRKNYVTDQYELLSPEQRLLPAFYIEHDPPREHPTDTTHWVQDGKTVIVQVTHFNELMWNTGEQPVRVIEHGVKLIQETSYRGTMRKGIVVINHLNERGRRLGLDLFMRARKEIPLDLVGMGSEQLGGLGEMPPRELLQLASQYRFMFSPIRYTSLGLALIEGMMVGLPIIGLATTELSDVITTGAEGLVSTNMETVIDAMHFLLAQPEAAQELSGHARSTARKRFGIERFVSDWQGLFQDQGLLPVTFERQAMRWEQRQ
jgi:glycosyltransferase involved in cell wall biosynthesis